MPRAMSVGARSVCVMKPSFIEEQEALGEHFEAIAEAELACTIRVPRRTAENLIAESRALAGELPATRAALEAGEISYQHAKVVINQAWSVPDEAKAAFEAEVLRSAGTVTASKLKNRARLLRERLHPETIRARHQKSVRDRAMFFEPEPDGMASLTLYDSAEKVAGAYERVMLAALSLQGPETGAVLSVGRDRYAVPEDLKRFLRVRDKTCRFPGCNRSAAHCDLDHSLDWQFDGLTAHDNLAHLCPACHALKSETGWRVLHLGGGTLEWTSPTGRTFVSEPATVIRSVSTTPSPAPPGRDAQSGVPTPF